MPLYNPFHLSVGHLVACGKSDGMSFVKLGYTKTDFHLTGIHSLCSSCILALMETAIWQEADGSLWPTARENLRASIQ